ncbi:MAG: type III pantothenate kinase [Cyanobacteriota bacterium]|nr:type III pantothenate kinase [Cyanobacteriota bacterium]
MNPAPAERWLLIGNSRWHWAERSTAGQLRGWDETPPEAGAEGAPLRAWASVGRLPERGCPPLDRRVLLQDVPLAGCPPWLGVDRALAGWGAWRERREAVLVADAGTVLSLTRVDSDGRFRGGRLLAGLRLQLDAMASHTTQLPRLSPAPASEDPLATDPAWPQATAGAMRVGVETALVAAVVDAARASGCQHLTLTGGDGPVLQAGVTPLLEALGIAVRVRPLLCLESLVDLRPAS